MFKRPFFYDVLSISSIMVARDNDVVEISFSPGKWRRQCVSETLVFSGVDSSFYRPKMGKFPKKLHRLSSISAKK